MYLKRSFFYILALIAVVFAGCSSSTDTLAYNKYEAWLKNKENGLIKEREYNGLVYSMLFLPGDYLKYKNKSNSAKDTLVDYYSQSLHFMMTIYLNNKNHSLLYLGIESMEDYKQRIMQLNFRLDSLLKMNINDKEYIPILTSFENTYGASPYANVNIVFSLPKEIKEGDEVDISFNDEIFGTGIQHFLFNYHQMKNAPKIK